MINKRTTHFRALLAVGTAVFLLVACSSSVVRETPSSSASHRIVSKPKYGATVQVQRGDTLYGVAFRNGIDFRDLATWNGIGAPYTIYPGQSLRLYPSSGKNVAATTTSPATVRPKPAAASVPPRPVAPPPAAAPANSGVSWR